MIRGQNEQSATHTRQCSLCKLWFDPVYYLCYHANVKCLPVNAIDAVTPLLPQHVLLSAAADHQPEASPPTADDDGCVVDVTGDSAPPPVAQQRCAAAGCNTPVAATAQPQHCNASTLMAKETFLAQHLSSKCMLSRRHIRAAHYGATVLCIL